MFSEVNMDGFLQANQSLMRTFGEPGVYEKVNTSGYDVETSTFNTELSSYSIKVRISMPKLSEINSPNLIGKEVMSVFILPDSRFIPEVNDKIKTNDAVYTVKVIIVQRGYAGVIVGYKLNCVKS